MNLKVILEFEVFYNNIAILIPKPITFLSTIVINRISFQGWTKYIKYKKRQFWQYVLHYDITIIIVSILKQYT